MRPIWLLGLAVAFASASATEKPCGAPVWKVNMESRFGFRPFQLPKHPRNQPPISWKMQQGVVFTAPDALAIFQVKENESLHPLTQRDSSGGSGRYSLEIIFLRHEGTELHRLSFITDESGLSAVYPTHDGRFLVVTGKVLRLYSPTFEELAMRPGPVKQNGERQYWRVVVIPPGRRIRAYVESTSTPVLLNADTLDTVLEPKPSDVALWPGGDDFFPVLRDLKPGVYTREGNWRKLEYDSGVGGCAFEVFVNAGKQVPFSAYRCKQMRVFSSEGQLVWNIPASGQIDSFSSNGLLLAAAIYRSVANPLDLDIGPKPGRIEIYDLGAKSKKCSIRISEVVSSWWDARYYDLSPTGGLAIAQGNLLSFYDLQ